VINIELTEQDLAVVVRALKSHRKECCVAIDAVKKLLGKEDPAYPQMTGEYYSDIYSATDLIDRLRAK
jgi:hypothetical protein